MSPRPKDEVPKGLIEHIQREMRNKGISLRTLAFEAGMDPGTLSRILSRQQGIPPNDFIISIANVLGIDPPELLLYEAGRIPHDTRLMPLLRATSELTQSELKEVLKLANRLARERRSGKRESK